MKRGAAQAVNAAEGAINPMAGPGMMRFYYQGQEFETRQEIWDKAYAQYAAAADREHDEVIAAGGLHIVGTERHESRRIDNQLRGRAGRQGDPGASRFYLSLEDDLMRIFAKEWVSNLLQRLGMEEGVPIESRMISSRIEAAQKAVEGQNFEARKHLLEYDDVMNKQRTAVYGLRQQLLEGLDQKELILEDYVANLLSAAMETHAPEAMHPDQWDINGLKSQLASQFGIDLEKEGIDLDTLNRHELGEALFERMKEKYEMKEAMLGSATMRYHERMVMLSVLDGLWKDHLLSMDHLKEGIGLRGYGQQDPLVAYKKESFDMFEAMMARFQEDTVRFLFLMQIVGPDGQPITQLPRRQAPEISSEFVPAVTSPVGPPVTGINGNGARACGRDSATAAGDPVPARAPSTTIDALEQEFQRKKKRELEHARMAGANGSSDAPRNAGPEKRSGGTIFVLAGRARNTKNATEWKRNCGSGDLPLSRCSASYRKLSGISSKVKLFAFDPVSSLQISKMRP